MMKKRSKLGWAGLGVATVALLAGLNFLDAKVFDTLNPFSNRPDAPQTSVSPPDNVSGISGSNAPLRKQVSEAVGADTDNTIPAIRPEFLEALIKGIETKAESEASIVQNTLPETTQQDMTTSEAEARLLKLFEQAQDAADAANQSGAAVDAEMLRIETMETSEGLRKLANAGDRDAQFLLAGQYLNGSDGTVKDINLAHDWFFKAFKQESDSAASGVIITVLNDDLDPDKLTTFNAWLESGISAGDAAAQFIGGQFVRFMNIPETEKNATRVKMTTDAAKSDFAPAMYDLGLIYLEGIGVEIDVDYARIWLNRAAKKGSESAAVKLQEISAQ